jgi:organic hydroperoxide reductase OsmC/OhrA
MKQHTYRIHTNWVGNDGEGTKNYRSYRRDHTTEAAGKPLIPCSSDPAFRGDPGRYNPEDLLVASLSSCHMLWYLHLCSVNHITVLEYQDEASGVMEEHEDGAGEFVGVRLQPRVRILAGGDRERALALHGEAHRVCFIARSVNFPVEVVAEIV